MAPRGSQPGKSSSMVLSSIGGLAHGTGADRHHLAGLGRRLRRRRTETRPSLHERHAALEGLSLALVSLDDRIADLVSECRLADVVGVVGPGRAPLPEGTAES